MVQPGGVDEGVAVLYQAQWSVEQPVLVSCCFAHTYIDYNYPERWKNHALLRSGGVSVSEGVAGDD
jgi:hypothetical protein